MSTEMETTFVLPAELHADAPPERRGIRRDRVRLMTLDRKTGERQHARFNELGRFLRPGDLLVLNASRTVPAVLAAQWVDSDGTAKGETEVRLSSRKREREWEALLTQAKARVGDELRFSPKLKARVIEAGGETPLSVIEFNLGGPGLFDEIYRLGQPVRYEYVSKPWELDYYQTVYASVPGSVEMPSAGRAFTWEVLLRLKQKGVGVAFVELHAGLSYLMDDNWHLGPDNRFEEYVIPQETAEAVARTKASGGRVIAVGTTVVRTLETAADEGGNLAAKSGWTNLYIRESYPLKIADGLITGFHEPEASHLELLSAFVPKPLLVAAYREAIGMGYLWHEFGDMNLIV